MAYMNRYFICLTKYYNILTFIKMFSGQNNKLNLF